MEPRFTFHGFRYAEIGGWPADAPPVPEGVNAVVCHSDMERTGWFSCSDERITKLHDNVVGGMRGNFLDVPTDCPQRDERLGWTGDINVFSPTACFLYDCPGFLASWLADLAAEQQPDGVIPLVVPDVLAVTFPAAIWGDAAVVGGAAGHRSRLHRGPRGRRRPARLAGSGSHGRRPAPRTTRRLIAGRSPRSPPGHVIASERVV